MNKDQLRHIAKEALKSKYGFSPAKNNIMILEAHGDGTYIMFSVNGIEYQFKSYKFSGDSVRVGNGTITKCFM